MLRILKAYGGIACKLSLFFLILCSLTRLIVFACRSIILLVCNKFNSIASFEKEVLLVVNALQVVDLVFASGDSFHNFVGDRIEVDVGTAEHSDIIVPVMQVVASFANEVHPQSVIEDVFSLVEL